MNAAGKIADVRATRRVGHHVADMLEEQEHHVAANSRNGTQAATASPCLRASGIRISKAP